MISKEDMDKVNRMNVLEQELSYTRYALPLTLVFVGVVGFYKSDQIPLALVITLTILGVLMMGWTVYLRKKQVTELKRLKQELTEVD
jgi:hypothetical protein